MNISLEKFVKKNSLHFIALALLLSSCSYLDKWKTPENAGDSVASTDAPAEIVPQPEFAADHKEDAKDDLAALSNKFDLNETPMTAPEEPTAPKTEVIAEVKDVPTPMMAAEETTGKIKFYKVKKGETLMQIAFKIYGDVDRWKDIKKMNQEKVSRNAALPANMTLKYMAPASEFVWNPVGNPYLIKTGETLGIISNNVYQTPKKWKDLWENNKPLIKNPNVIFAGFTLYYQPQAGLANYVQPKEHNKKVGKVIGKAKVQRPVGAVEKIDVAQELMKVDNAEKTDTAARAPASVDTKL
jgi:nucleoid-associated protein YgaU